MHEAMEQQTVTITKAGVNVRMIKVPKEKMKIMIFFLSSRQLLLPRPQFWPQQIQFQVAMTKQSL
jgi:hypothetical protein